MENIQREYLLKKPGKKDLKSLKLILSLYYYNPISKKYIY